MTTAIVMPFSGRTEERFRAASWVRLRLATMYPDYPLHVATEGGEPWSKARAVNHCARNLAVESFVVHDADCVIPNQALRWAVHELESVPWAMPYHTVYRLHSEATADTLAQSPGVEVTGRPLADCDPHRPPYDGVPGGGIFAVTRSAWDMVGGFDERFEGWGYEDAALGWALDTLAGEHTRLDAPLWHLWHPQAPRHRDGVAGNHALEIEYRRARGNPRAMRALTKNPRKSAR